MKSIGIITIHKICNYGSVLQAYALQRVCEELGCEAEIIDYQFPNDFHSDNRYATTDDTQANEPKRIKALFARALMRQHKSVAEFVGKYQKLSRASYLNPDDLRNNPPRYDVYITGSDQLWSPRHCNGDPAFMLHFAPDEALKISYASSIGSNKIPDELLEQYSTLLGRYSALSVRENSGADIVKGLTGNDVSVVLDPTLLLNKDEWNSIATNRRQFREKYILCYFLNYSFNAFPYVDELAAYLQEQTGYELIRVARPPHHLCHRHTHYRVGASPEEFLALVRDAELVLTTSFHGTAFAVNYGIPVCTVVKDRNAGDSRQVSLMTNLGLEKNICSITDEFPSFENLKYDVAEEQLRLDALRKESINFLTKALSDGRN